MYKSKKHYQEIVQVKKDYKQIFKDFCVAFICGGMLAILGQSINDLFKLFVSPKDANLYMLISIIGLAGILTGIGVYDNIGQFAKCGVAIPISGFANSCVSSAMEYKKEGLILGIGANTMKIAGTVIVLGTVMAFLVASIKYLIFVIS